MEEIVRMLDYVYTQVSIYLESKQATSKHKQLIMRVIRHELDLVLASIVEQVDELKDMEE